MNHTTRHQIAGFNMIHVLLIIVIVSMVLVRSMSYYQQKNDAMVEDRVVLQLKQIIDAEYAYYMANGRWADNYDAWRPISSGTATQLQPDYLPARAMLTPYNATLNTGSGAGSVFPYYTLSAWDGNIAIFMVTKTNAQASRITARFVGGSSSGNGVTIFIRPPGSTTNTATAFNFAGIYHQGACIPAPDCPKTSAGVQMVPQVLVLPVSVSGMNDNASTDAYPISSFTVYVSGTSPIASPAACAGSIDMTDPGTPTCPSSPVRVTYWRACMRVITERGNVQVTRTDATNANYWGKDVAMTAFTRCSIPNEPVGSPFTVWGN